MITRKPSSLSTYSATTPSRSAQSVSRSSTPTQDQEWDADDEDQGDIMSGDDSTYSRPLSVAIPSHPPTFSRRPGLREILANTAPTPWTLSAFMAYLSNNHCLETLEFTMDAGRYKKHYTKMMAKATEKGKLSTKDADNIKVLWQRLVEAYIKPNGSREVNLPSEVRDPILNLDYSTVPPAPETLDPAVVKIYELMEDSVLVPFLNSLTPPTSQHGGSSSHVGHSESYSATSQTYDERGTFGFKGKYSRGISSPEPLERNAHSYSDPLTLNRKSAPPSTLSTAMKQHRFSRNSPTSSGASPGPAGHAESGSSFPGLTDDSGSTSSPTNESPMTPPTSPPAGEAAGSPRVSRDWKKFGRLSQWKPSRKKSQTFDAGKTI